MWKLIKVFLAGIVVSLYYFPFEFSFFAGVNTKMMLAVVGVVLCAQTLISKRDFSIPPGLFCLILLSGLVSIIGVFSVVYNNTSDYAYATYIISMIVWLSAAYTVCCVINKVHGKIDVELLASYIVTVCVIQCFLALIIDANPVFKSIVDTYISQGQDYLNEVDRIYGIGANLDVAGTRFSAALIMIAFLINKNKAVLSRQRIYYYVFSYMVLMLLGNMIARTTSVGLILSVLYLLFAFKPLEARLKLNSLKIIGYVLLAAVVAIPVVVHLYNTNDQIHGLLRFAFEGFFNLAETGEYSVASTQKLATMYVFPESSKTWIIGDGYFSNPRFTDPYFIGKITNGYYMGTDVGYLRFIFYFGLIGLFAFSLFMCYAAKLCVRGLPAYKWLFILILISGFVIWLKVSTDIFLVFALFLCVANMQPVEELKSDDIVQE